MMVSDGKNVGCGVRRPQPTEWEDEVLDLVVAVFEIDELAISVGDDECYLAVPVDGWVQ